jgi:hypothetical protein
MTLLQATRGAGAFALAAVFVLALIPASELSARGQKKARVRKFTPEQVQEAEFRLRAANCLILRREPLREPWEALLARRGMDHRNNKPVDPSAPIELVGFPNDTSDADLAKLLPLLERFESLKAVQLWNTSKVTAKGLKLIATKLPYIQGLILSDVRIADDALAELAALKSLTWLVASDGALTDGGLKELASSPTLTSLTSTRNRGVSAAGIRTLAGMKSLRELKVDISRDPLGMASALGQLGNLSRLNAYPVGDEEAVHIGRLKQLTSLDLLEPDDALTRAGGRGSLTDAGIHEFVGCKALTTLRVTGRGIVIETLPELAMLADLRELSLSNTGTSDAALSILARMKGLERLELRRTAVTDKGVRLLADLPRLAVLDISENRVGDESLEVLTRVRSLLALAMDDTQVAASALELGSFACLKHLSLQAANVSPASFKSLAKARSVLVLDLQRNCPNVNPANVRPLKAALGTVCSVLTDGCGPVESGWPGAVGYAFRSTMPDVKPPSSIVTGPPRTEKPEPKVVPKPMPQPPPAQRPPPPPSGGIGGSRP